MRTAIGCFREKRRTKCGGAIRFQSEGEHQVRVDAALACQTGVGPRQLTDIDRHGIGAVPEFTRFRK